jgi:hypothetical protein
MNAPRQFGLPGIRRAAIVPAMRAPENKLHKAIVNTLRIPRVLAPAVLWFHAPNGFWIPGASREASARAWIQLEKDKGARAGVADLTFVHGGKVLFLELKREGEKQSPAQLLFAEDAIKAGARYEVRDSYDGTIILLFESGIITSTRGLVR